MIDRLADFVFTIPNSRNLPCVFMQDTRVDGNQVQVCVCAWLLTSDDDTDVGNSDVRATSVSVVVLSRTPLVVYLVSCVKVTLVISIESCGSCSDDCRIKMVSSDPNFSMIKVSSVHLLGAL